MNLKVNFSSGINFAFIENDSSELYNTPLAIRAFLTMYHALLFNPCSTFNAFKLLVENNNSDKYGSLTPPFTISRCNPSKDRVTANYFFVNPNKPFHTLKYLSMWSFESVFNIKSMIFVLCVSFFFDMNHNLYCRNCC